MVKIEKKADMMQFGKLIQFFIILSDKELLFDINSFIPLESSINSLIFLFMSIF